MDIFVTFDALPRVGSYDPMSDPTDQSTRPYKFISIQFFNQKKRKKLRCE
jgi:hypothetical protein